MPTDKRIPNWVYVLVDIAFVVSMFALALFGATGLLLLGFYG